MNEDAGATELEDTTPLLERRVEERLQELQAELEVNARANGALAQAAGVDGSKLPSEQLRELDEIAERMFKLEPPPLPSDEGAGDAVRRS